MTRKEKQVDLFDDGLTEVKPEDVDIFKRLIDIGEEMVGFSQKTGVRFCALSFPDGKCFVDAYFPGEQYKWFSANNCGIVIGTSAEYEIRRCRGGESEPIALDEVNFEGLK